MSWIAHRDSAAVFGDLSIPDDVLANLKENIARRLTPQPVKIRADIDLTCFSYAGIDAIRRALRAGESLKSDAIPIQIRLVAPPLYVIISNATDKTGAIEALENAIAAIREEIQKDNGELVVKRRVRSSPTYMSRNLFHCAQPAAVSESDDVELNALMERVARENAEVSGAYLRPRVIYKANHIFRRRGIRSGSRGIDIRGTCIAYQTRCTSLMRQ